jgi:hypothetical protein
MPVFRSEVDWYRSTPWWRLLSKTIQISWRTSHLALCLLGILLHRLAYNLETYLFQIPATSSNGSILASTSVEAAPSDLSKSVFANPLDLASIDLSIANLFPIPNAMLPSLSGFAFLIVYFLTSLAIWSFVGGIIARRAIMELGVRTSVGWGPTVQLVVKRWRSILWATTLPIVSILLISVIPIFLGLIARAGSIGAILGLIGAILSIPVMLAFGWVAFLMVAGYPISLCSIIAEKNADAFDGLARAAAYLFQRPMTLLLAGIVGIAGCIVGLGVFSIAIRLGISMFICLFEVGLGASISVMAQNSSMVVRSLIASLSGIVALLETAYLFTFFWSAAAAIYLVLRWEIDHTDFDDLDLQELGEPIEMPPVATAPE